MYFQIFKGVNNQWYWRLKAANHETIAVSEGIQPNKTAYIALV